mgnify:CR=1 FL=1
MALFLCACCVVARKKVSENSLTSNAGWEWGAQTS